MNKAEASELLGRQLEAWRRRSFAELSNKVGRAEGFEVTGPSGTWYQGNISVHWDAEPDGAIRVIGAIDDGGWRAFVPLTADFIIAPDGSFVDE